MICGYVFNEKVTGRIYDFSNGNHFDLDSILNIGYTSVLSDGYDAIFGVSSKSYGTSSTFILPVNQQPLTISLRIKCASAPSSSFVLVKKGASFSVSINSSGFIVFSIKGDTGTFSKTSSINICDGVYHTIVCTSDGSILQIYTDAIPENATTTAVYATIFIDSGLLIVGAASTSDTTTYFQGQFNYIFISETALQAIDVSNLSGSAQKGVLVGTGGTNLIIGDLLLDDSESISGIVTWSPDGVTMNVLPYGPMIEIPLYKVGHLYNPLRQAFMELIDDFDGNGNGQINIKKDIDSIKKFPDAISQTIDYSGISNMPGIGLVWMSEFQQRGNTAGVDTNAYLDVLSPLILGTEGDWATFKYIFKVNATGGTVNILLNGAVIYALTPSATGLYWVEGELIAEQILDGAAVMFIKDSNNNFTSVAKTINFGQENKMIFQLTSTNDNDIVAMRGQGIVHNININ